MRIATIRARRRTTRWTIALPSRSGPRAFSWSAPVTQRDAVDGITSRPAFDPASVGLACWRPTGRWSGFLPRQHRRHDGTPHARVGARYAACERTPAGAGQIAGGTEPSNQSPPRVAQRGGIRRDLMSVRNGTGCYSRRHRGDWRKAMSLAVPASATMTVTGGATIPAHAPATPPRAPVPSLRNRRPGGGGGCDASLPQVPRSRSDRQPYRHALPDPAARL